MKDNPAIAEKPELEKIRKQVIDLVETVIDNAFRETGDLLDMVQRKEEAKKVMAENGSPLFTVAEAARYLRIGRSTLNLFKSQGKIKEVKLNSRIFFRQTSLDEFLEQCEQECNR